MSKLLLIPRSFEEINETLNYVDGYIIGYKDLSINMNLNIDSNELDRLPKDKDIFISINKNLENRDLEVVRTALTKLNNYNIKGVLFYDVGLINIYDSMNLNYDLVLSQEHLSTNYNTINFYNTKYTYLSSDITLDEINEISKNTKSILMVNVFGYLPMFFSKRHIVKNYLDYFKLKDDSIINYFEKEGNIYPIIDNELGTVCYSSNILNGLKESLNMNVEYKVINSFNINNIIEVLKIFKNVNKDNINVYFTKLNNMFDNCDSAFLNKKTIYRVKKNEK